MDDWDDDFSSAKNEGSSSAFGMSSLTHVLGTKVRGVGRGSGGGDSGGGGGSGFGSHRNGSSDDHSRSNGFGGSRGGGGGGSFGKGRRNFSGDDSGDDNNNTRKTNGFGGGRGGGGFGSGGGGRRNFGGDDDEDNSNNSRKPNGFGGGGFGSRGGDGGFGGGQRSNGFQNDDEDDSGSRQGRGFGGRGGRGGGGGGGREGDWICPDEDCGNKNFAFRRNCQKCDTPKPMNGESGGGNGGFGGGSGGRGGREGDWVCPDESCANRNFAFRKNCQKCDTPKPAGSNSGGGGGGGGRGGGFGGDSGGGNRGGREGDWICPDEDCGNKNFAFRKNCQKCDTPKPADSNGGGQGGGFGGGSGGGRAGREGDWICPDASCGNNNFAFRKNCQKCDTPKPGDIGGGDGSDKPREAPYIPPAPSDKEEDIFGGRVEKGINFDKYDDIPVEVSGRDQCGFISSFEEGKLLPTFLQNIKRAKYDRPTPIQKYSIPIITAKRDLMACAQTGSGKTAAFVLPVLTSMVNRGLTTDGNQDVQTPQAICVAPTRELALQIYTDCRKFAYNTEIRPVVVYGGTSTGYQLRQIENGAHFVIGTPGRLLDVINRGKIDLSCVQFLILDEADRMLDMGFEPDIRKLVETLGMPAKTERQTLMFSATFPEEIQKLAGDFLNDYLFVTVGRVGGANTDVTQNFFEVDRVQKRECLCDILNSGGTDRTLVFVEQKRNADFLASYLCQSGFPTTSIHGDRLQREREEALRDFKSGKCYILVATSVAARGLDIPDVVHVVNYDLPSSIDEYVHRIGRTGRCGNLGKATSFFSVDTDQAMAANLVRILKEAQQVVPDWLKDHASGMGAGDGGSFGGRFGGKDIRRQRSGGGGGNRGNEQTDTWAAGTGAGVDDDDESWD